MLEITIIPVHTKLYTGIRYSPNLAFIRNLQTEPKHIFPSKSKSDFSYSTLTSFHYILRVMKKWWKRKQKEEVHGRDRWGVGGSTETIKKITLIAIGIWRGPKELSLDWMSSAKRGVLSACVMRIDVKVARTSARYDTKSWRLYYLCWM